MSRLSLALLLLAATAAHAAPVPADITRYATRRAGCNHWAGEEGYDKARQADINRNIASLKCEALDSDEKRLTHRYRHSPKNLRRIRAAHDALL